MELRRPTLEDKDAILEMIAEFDAAKSYMHGGMGSTWKRAKDYEDWLQMVRRRKMWQTCQQVGFLLSSWLVLT